MLPDYKGIRDLLSRTCCMVRDFLLEEVYHDCLPEELAEEWGTTYQHVNNILQDDMLPTELLTVLQFSGLEFGVAIRDPGSGKEVTFFAANNLAEPEDDEDTMDRITEEVIVYDGSDKKGDEGRKPGEGIPDTIPRIHAIVDGSYTIDEKDSPKNPFEDDVIDAEYSEITERDLREMTEMCENCLSNERIPDSVLCHFCLEAGVICNPPDDPNEPEIDPLELMARVNAQAEQAVEKSKHLLELAAGGDPEEEEEEEEDWDEEEEDTPIKPRRHEEEEEPSWMDSDEDKYAPEVRKFFDFSDEEE